MAKCPICRGRGYEVKHDYDPLYPNTTKKRCSPCEGTGRVARVWETTDKVTCPTCRGDKVGRKHVGWGKWPDGSKRTEDKRYKTVKCPECRGRGTVKKEHVHWERNKRGAVARLSQLLVGVIRLLMSIVGMLLMLLLGLFLVWCLLMAA